MAVALAFRLLAYHLLLIYFLVAVVKPRIVDSGNSAIPCGVIPFQHVQGLPQATH